MAFGNPYGYAPMYGGYMPQQYAPQPMQDQLAQLRTQQYPPQYPPAQQPAQGAPIWVQGEAAAKAYLVAPGQTLMLMDSEAEVFYIKATGPDGVPQKMRVFDYKERSENAQSVQTAVSPPDMSALEAKIDALAAMISKMSNPSPTAKTPEQGAGSEYTRSMRRAARAEEGMIDA